MNEHETPVPVLQAILDELQQLHMEQAVQRGAYLVLVRQLAVRGHMPLADLAADLQLIANTQYEPGWREGYESLAGAVLLADTGSSANLKCQRQHL